MLNNTFGGDRIGPGDATAKRALGEEGKDDVTSFVEFDETDSAAAIPIDT